MQAFKIYINNPSSDAYGKFHFVLYFKNITFSTKEQIKVSLD